MRYLLTSLLLLPCIVMAQQLHSFKNGEVADAEEINQNFSMVTQTLYSGDSYVGRIIPWDGDNILTLTDKGYFARLGIWGPDYAELGWSGFGTNRQSIFFASEDCWGLGYIWAGSIRPVPFLYRGVLGHVYARQTQDEEPSFSPATDGETREAMYIAYNQPLEPSVLPLNLYRRNNEGDCISEQPLTDMTLYEEKANDPAVTGYSFGVELTNLKIDIGL